MLKFPATVTMAAEGGWSLRRVYIVNRQLSRALVAQRVAGRWSLRFWYCESALSLSDVPIVRDSHGTSTVNDYVDQH